MKGMLLFALLSVAAAGARCETVEIDDRTFTYEEEGGVWKLKSVLPATGDLVIPCALGGRYVSTIASNAFYRCWGLDSVTVSVGITNIEEGAFCECKYMRSVSLPRGLKIIYPKTFMGCCSLTKVTVPDGVEVLGYYSFCGCTGLTEIDLPESLREIGSGAFYLDCSLKEIRLPDGIEQVRTKAFLDCTSLTNVVFGSSVWCVREDAFRECTALGKLTVPESMEYFGAGSFADCTSLREIDFECPPPEFVGEPGFSRDVRIRYNVAYADWWAEAIEEYGFTNAEAYYPESPAAPPAGTTSVVTNFVAVTVTNVVVNYVFNSVRPEFAVPASADAGFVSVITEVRSGGCVAVPETWADGYPGFAARFGGDFAKALAAKTGKRDGSGNEMFVWQDYVAGTDPTKSDDVFRASVAIVGGKPVVSWTPELDDERAALRKYVVCGKERLADADWSVVDGDAEKYNFFKVTVEMR